uniref:Uncharacterized protein n=1 Tax=Fagus sylvatica TaxID=28930 RepID=A0A2N9G7A4_FAGSY
MFVIHGVHLKKKVVKDVPLLHIIMLDTHGVHLKKKVVKDVPLLHIIMFVIHGVHLKKKVVKDVPLLHIIMLDTHRVHLKKKVVKDVPLLHIIMFVIHGVHLKKKIVKNAHLLHVIMLDTHGVHLKKKVVKDVPLLHVIMLDTHGVHLKKKVVKNAPFLNIYQVRHPRGASKEEGRQGRSSSTYYHVRHPRGAFKEEDRQERSSSTYYVRHPRGASKEEGRQGRAPLLNTIKFTHVVIYQKKPPVDTCPNTQKPSHPTMTSTPDTRGTRNYFYDPGFSYSDGRLHRQPRNRGATDVDILHLFSNETAHRVDSPPTIGVLHESREPSPCTSHSTTIPTSADLPGEGLLTHHVSSDPTEPRRPRAVTRRYKKPFLSPLLRYEQYFSDTEIHAQGLPFLGSTDCRPVTFQQLQFLVGCATVDMKMQTLVISLEMQIPDINSN